MENLEGFTATSVDGAPVQEQQIPIQNENEENKGESQAEGVVQETGNQEAQITDAVQEQPTTEIPVREQAGSSQEVQQTQQEENQKVENTFETTTVDFGEKKDATIPDAPAPGKDLLTFIEENQDLITSYDKLNKNFDELEQEDLVREYLNSKHKGLSNDDIDTLLNEYSWDEEVDDKAEIVKKKIALSNITDEAKSYLGQQQETLRQELAKRSLGGPTQAELEQRQVQQEAVEHFNQSTTEFFSNQEFEGFAFQLNDEKGMKLKINNKEAIQNNQASIETFLKPYFDEGTGKLTDPQGYHRAIFAAMNIDAITKNAYEQGKSDAISTAEREAKNIDMDGRKTHDESQGTGSGTKWTIS